MYLVNAVCGIEGEGKAASLQAVQLEHDPSLDRGAEVTLKYGVGPA